MKKRRHRKRRLFMPQNGYDPRGQSTGVTMRDSGLLRIRTGETIVTIPLSDKVLLYIADRIRTIADRKCNQFENAVSRNEFQLKLWSKYSNGEPHA